MTSEAIEKFSGLAESTKARYKREWEFAQYEYERCWSDDFTWGEFLCERVMASERKGTAKVRKSAYKYHLLQVGGARNKEIVEELRKLSKGVNKLPEGSRSHLLLRPNDPRLVTLSANARACVVVAYYAALRISEVCGLEAWRIRRESNRVYVVILPHDKRTRGPVRVPFPVNESTRAAVMQIYERGKTLGKSTMSGYMSERDVMFHSLRRARAVDLLWDGVPSETVMIACRWRSVEAFRSYTEYGISLLVAAQGRGVI